MNIRFAIVAAAALAGAAAWGQPSRGSWLEFWNPAVTGKPFSATAKSRLVHTLEDGTHIDQTTMTVMYRDAQGRTRNETDNRIQIMDPVAHHEITLDPETHRAVQAYVEGGAYVPGKEELDPHPAGIRKGQAYKSLGPLPPGATARKRQESAPVVDDLGLKTVNGVFAHGVRTTLTIPAGFIGNDRDVKVVNETWTSEDLHMLIKSINSDPRFGTSTYELTNIVQAAPSADLFQIPAGYSVKQSYRQANVGR
jgi:hypothetical protein